MSETRTNALHWAAIAHGLFASGGRQSAEGKAAHARYIDNAHAHGITDAEIDEYLRTRLRK
ncbi:hypothetical protein ACWGVR_14255 [Streptomyces xanthophaeus]